jgi:hypothetical protein
MVGAEIMEPEMKGKRVWPDENGWLTTELELGEYGRAQPLKMADGSPVPAWMSEKKYCWWQVRAPNGHSGCLDPLVHQVTEHEDGTITVYPSIVIRGPGGQELFHGWLRNGTWSNA